MDEPTTDNATEPQVTRGTHVFDVNGEKIGVVAELDPENDGFLVEEGHFLPKEVPIPMSAVASVNADGVHLTVSKEDAAVGNWHDGAVSASADQSPVDTQTPYRADPAQSVGDRDLDVGQDR